MITLIILVGGFILQCSLNTQSVCSFIDTKSLGLLLSAGVLETLVELRGVITIFQKKDKD